MNQVTRKIQNKNFVFDIFSKDQVDRTTPTVVVLLKNTAEEGVYESFCIDIYDNPSKEFSLHPRLQEIEKADYALLLKYENLPDPEEDKKILKALGDILFSYFKNDRIVTLDK
jgi:hypothetical protein